ncbi:Fic family protein [Gemmiger formicilis]|uniref:Fic family protein n=1 Tax=Gemmiger formicilis TaxID=745368 RepID=UPI00195B9750|nr:Fic family protein [Gemmiger formicilis]MBM6899438.1 Fic family protein [Gemmiger formicilis]
MDSSVFAKMLSDPGQLDLKKMGYKYGQENLQGFLTLHKQYFYQELPLHDFDGNSMVCLDKAVPIPLSAARVLLTLQQSSRLYGTKAMEDEILSTFRIEQIDTSRESVRRILSGRAPENEEEHRIYGMKQGLEFIADRSHTITEENLFRLYQMTIGDFLPEEDRLLPGHWYRHDGVTVIDGKTEHTGLPWQKLPAYMKELMAFAAEKAAQNDLIKAAILHFGLAYLHPYFDGNGRMARLLHLWYLVQQGYSSALFVPMSRFVEESCARYYKAYTRVEQNQLFSGVLDVTPFLVYFAESVYYRLEEALLQLRTLQAFEEALRQGKVTEKERALWQFVLTAYGSEEFSTKRLEKDFGDAAYATIRSFVLKFERLGLLTSVHYGNRVKYRIQDGK